MRTVTSIAPGLLCGAPLFSPRADREPARHGQAPSKEGEQHPARRMSEGIAVRGDGHGEYQLPETLGEEAILGPLLGAEPPCADTPVPVLALAVPAHTELHRQPSLCPGHPERPPDETGPDEASERHVHLAARGHLRVASRAPASARPAACQACQASPRRRS